jgi:hypothetical protein
MEISIGTDGYRNAQNVFLSELSPIAQPAIFEIRLCQGRNGFKTHKDTDNFQMFKT